MLEHEGRTYTISAIRGLWLRELVRTNIYGPTGTLTCVCR